MKLRFSWLLLTAWTTSVALLDSVHAESNPNVLILLVDDLGQRDIGAYHRESFYETPRIDRLASEGVLFTDGYAANPVCSPTRYSVMTGKHPTRAQLTNWLPGQRNERFRDAPIVDDMALSEVTIAEILRSVGYRTALVGKWHLGESESHWPEHQGFDYNLGGWSKGRPDSYFSPYKNPRLKDGPPGEYLPVRLANETSNLLRQFHSEKKPFFLVHSFYEVHGPLQAPEELIEKYRRKAERLGLENKFGEEKQYLYQNSQQRRVREVQSHATYAAMMESLDRAVGTILDTLKELGLDQNTFVVFVSDNGGLATAEGLPTSNLPWRAGKGWVFEGGIRVPFIVKSPTTLKRGGIVNSAPVVTTDLVPTILALAGVKPPAGVRFDGVNFLPLLAQPRSGDLERPLYWHYPHYSNQGGFPGGAVRKGQWKLIENYEDGSVSLYNLQQDPGEKRDLALEQPDRVAEMRGQLHAWYRETGAQFLRPGKAGTPPWTPGSR
ncbi:MAG TPA: sulfatase [Opitutaceae bacterium]|nr:sulfatase [Opitutaceae bacterium]